MSETREPTEAFPYARNLGIKAGDTAALLEKIEAGLPFRTFVKLQKAMDLPQNELAAVVQIRPRTLARRKTEGRLRPDESDRLLRISRIFDIAVELFEGDLGSARKWLTTPQRALQDKMPLEFAKSEVGSREVENLMGRLEHGIYS
jgi:putative toxin-antitoxin system antitoxin component (TIGR02293 family)